MKISTDRIDLSCDEAEIYRRLLSLDNKHILELGCGGAEKTRDIATSGLNRKITALEVDEIAHGENLQLTDLPNVSFGLSGAQDIPLPDESVDIVMMFKSLHHVPPEHMESALGEIRRVLKPAGLAYISEPVFAGDFNEILRLFHDEQKVREGAFDAVNGDEMSAACDVFLIDRGLDYKSNTWRDNGYVRRQEQANKKEIRHEV